MKEFTHCLALDRTSVDSEVPKVCQQLLGTVLALHQFEKVGGVVNELWKTT